MVHGVERDASLQPGRLVAEARGHPGVGALVKTEREKEQDKLEYGNNECSGLQANTPEFWPFQRMVLGALKGPNSKIQGSMAGLRDSCTARPMGCGRNNGRNPKGNCKSNKGNCKSNRRIFDFICRPATPRTKTCPRRPGRAATSTQDDNFIVRLTSDSPL
jgi:hypothetical protein